MSLQQETPRGGAGTHTSDTHATTPESLRQDRISSAENGPFRDPVRADPARVEDLSFDEESPCSRALLRVMWTSPLLDEFRVLSFGEHQISDRCFAQMSRN